MSQKDWEETLVYIRKFRKHWRAIAATGRATYMDKVELYTGQDFDCCWLCDADSLFEDDCSYCPIKWGTGLYNSCDIEGSPYLKWYEAKKAKDRKKAALEVSKLKISKEVRERILNR